jgi:integrase
MGESGHLAFFGERYPFYRYMPRPRPIQFEVRKSKPYHGKPWRITGYIDGKRKALWYATEKQAKAEAAWRNTELAAYGSKITLDAGLRLESFRARELLAGTGLSILDAVRFTLDHHNLVARSTPFSEFTREYQAEIAARRAAGNLRPRSADALRYALRGMERYFGEMPVCEITPERLTEWLAGLPLALRTRRQRRGYTNQILAAALKRGYLTANPMKEVEAFKANGDSEEISILSPEQVSRLLEVADEEMRLLYALAAFSGIRWGEIARLAWSDIKDSEIVVGAAKAKTRSRRVVEILPNLKAFLEPVRGRTGPLISSPRSLERIRQRIERAAGLVPWPVNALRHSFISYLFALTHDENKVAAMAGNSPEMVHRHYRALVSREEAARYFEIGPR